MAANARSVVASVKRAARVMVPQRSGCILCTASTAGVLGDVVTAPRVQHLQGRGHRRGARRGGRAGTPSPWRAGERHLATQFGLRVLARTRGTPRQVIARDMDSDEELRRIVERDMNELRGAVLEAEDVGRAAVYLALASDEAKYVTGNNLVVDGGYTVVEEVVTSDMVPHVDRNNSVVLRRM